MYLSGCRRPGVDPIGQYPLVGPTELPRPGQHAAAIDPHRETERLAILQRQRLAGQLGCAVEGNRRGGGERFVEPRGEIPGGSGAPACKRNAPPDPASTGSAASGGME